MTDVLTQETYRAYVIQVRRRRRLEATITPPGWFRPMDEVLPAKANETQDGLIGRARIVIDRDLQGDIKRRR